MATLGARILAPEKRDARRPRRPRSTEPARTACWAASPWAWVGRWPRPSAGRQWAGAGSATVEVKLNTEFFSRSS